MTHALRLLCQPILLEAVESLVKKCQDDKPAVEMLLGLGSHFTQHMNSGGPVLEDWSDQFPRPASSGNIYCVTEGATREVCIDGITEARCLMMRRFVHYVWRHWEQLKRIPGISWAAHCAPAGT